MSGADAPSRGPRRSVCVALAVLVLAIVYGALSQRRTILEKLDLESLDAFTSLLSPSFEVGRAAHARGARKKDSVILIPGIISTGLESWSTSLETEHLFRKSVWGGGGTGMLRALIGSPAVWLQAMSLDTVTGLDNPGYKVRALQGIDAAASFMPGYWIWEKIIFNLAVLGYDPVDMHLASYDWRLSYNNLEGRDQYFSALKSRIELNLARGRKTSIVAHSMGSSVTLYFLKWVEARAGEGWVEEHVSNFVNIAGTLLGVPKSMTAVLSGEFSDTVVGGMYETVGLGGVWERIFSRSARAALFQSWGGAASMLLKGGNAVWGDEHSAPDDVANTTQTFGHLYLFADGTSANLTLDASTNFLLQNSPSTFQRMLSSNYSFGIERNPALLRRNNADPTKWSNPLESTLPNAPSLKIYCLYGVGKATERAYFYNQDGAAVDSSSSPACDPDTECASSSLEVPLKHNIWIDSRVNFDSTKNGVTFGEGDGTVSLLSLGAMCVEGWAPGSRYNPAGISVVTHEINHIPVSFDPRGGVTTSDHVDILGNSELNEAIIDIVSGEGDRVQTQIFSDIQKYSKRIKW